MDMAHFKQNYGVEWETAPHFLLIILRSVGSNSHCLIIQLSR